MDIRNILEQKKESKVKKIRVLLCLLFCIGIIAIILFLVYTDKTKIIYTIGEHVQVEWKLQADDNYPTNTHKVFNWKTTFGIRSTTLNLNYFLWETVSFNWEVLWIHWNYPIIEINDIKIPKEKLIISNNRYFFTQDLISFDFSKENEIYAKKNWGVITIYHQNTPVMTVETFICSKITPTQDCEKLILTYTKNQNDLFSTYLWYTFYRNKENSRVTFNNDTIWYIFKTSDEKFLLNISHLINIVNSKFLKEQKWSFILESCIDENYRLSSINEISKDIIDADLIKLNISGRWENWESLTCKLNINIFNDRSIENKTINVS